MTKMRFAVAGLVHDHVWGLLKDFSRLDGVGITSAYDPNKPLLEKIQKEHAISSVYRDLGEMLDRQRPEALIVCGSNTGGAETVVKAAARGIHCLVEKPMAATADQARAMMKASQKGGGRIMVNWPLAWNASVVHALELLEGGDIGQVFHARVHMAHQGPKEAGCTPYFYNWLYDAKENGGGAILDYCCYGANIFATLWGRPKQVLGVARNLVKPNFPVDDNAMITAIYDDRVCLSQASWTQNPDFHDSLFLGSKGTLMTDRGKLIRSHTNPRDFNHHGASSLEVREVPLEPLPVGRRNGPEHFLSCLRSDKPFYKLCSAESGVLAQEILSAGVKSEETGKRINLGGAKKTRKRAGA